jgi:hypothetical protein
MSDWLEQELTRQFAPVAAPDGLWDRIHEQRRPLRTNSRLNPVLAIAVASLMVLLAVLLGQQARPAEFRSADPAEIRAWIRSHAGFDVPLPNQPPEGGEPVSLVSARLERRRGEPVAAITYRVGNEFVDMRVAPAGKPAAGHSPPRVESTANTRTVSWDMGKESYSVTLNSATAANHACILCHADPPGMVAFN